MCEGMLVDQVVSACLNTRRQDGESSKLEERGRREKPRGMKARKKGREKEREREIKDFPFD